MTPEEIQSLRNWSMGKMGWTIENPEAPRWCQKFIPGLLVERVDDWQPDTDLNQAFMLVNRMRELGWYIDLANGPEAPYWECSIFTDVSAPYRDSIIRESDTPSLAILLAARATEEDKTSLYAAARNGPGHELE